MSGRKFDVFLSYQWASQEDVKRLYNKLTAYDLKVWMDIYQMQGGVNLHERLVEGIASSRYFVCCVTKKYGEAKNCENELCMAYDSNKRIIAVMFEDAPMSELSGSGLILARLLRINVFDDKGFLEMSSPSPKFTELLDSIRKEELQRNPSSNMDSHHPDEHLEKDRNIITIIKSDVTKRINEVSSGVNTIIKAPLKTLYKFP